jgi:hypothetical protein
MRCRPFLIFTALALPLMAGCAQKGSSDAASAGCPVERTEFAAAAQTLPEAPAPDAASYWTQLHQAGSDTLAIGRKLSDDMAALGSSIDRIDRGYGALDACRRGRANALRTGLADAKLSAGIVAQRLADEKQAFETELALGRAAAGRIGARQSVLQAAAEKLVAAEPGASVKVAKAVAASPLPATPYMVTQPGEIFTQPNAASARIADLRKGQRVTGPGGGPASGWTTLTLNDGSLGYVDSGVLRQVQPNPSAVKLAAQARVRRAASGDPVVALALTARETLPGKTQAFVSRLDLAAGSAEADFAATPPVAAVPSTGIAAPGGPVAPSS